MEKLVMTDGEKIKNIREKYNLKQDEISGEDITRNLISEIETNKANITKKTAEIIIKNLTQIGKRKGFKVTETVDYLTENQIKQATKVLDDYIAELKTLSISKDNSFIKVLKDTEEFLINWDIKEKKIIIYELAGDYFYNQNDVNKSLLYYERTYTLLSKLTPSKTLLTILRKLSMIYGYLGRYKESIECCEFALNHFGDMSKKDSAIFRHNNSLNYKHIGDFEKALFNAKEAENLVENVDKSLFEVLNNKANCLYRMKRYQEAINVFNEVLNFIDKDDNEKYSILLINIINNYMSLNIHDKVIENLNILLEKLPQIGNDASYLDDIYFETGKVYKYLSNIELEESYYVKALEFSEERKNYVLANNVLCALIEIYTIANNDEKMDNLKKKIFLISNKLDRVNDVLMYKLIAFYCKSDKAKEIVDFSLNLK